MDYTGKKVAVLDMIHGGKTICRTLRNRQMAHLMDTLYLETKVPR